ncbi:tyrosine-type recombinase/integrase [Nocardia sp. NPDC004722]
MDRDRVLFELAYVTGARISEACGVDDEHVTLHGKGGKVRTALLDDRGFVALLRLYLQRTGYTTGPLFRASINGRGGSLSPSAARSRLQNYCAAAGIAITPHQLRHAHAQELTDADVNPEVIRRRLGHSRLETTLIYAQAKDAMVDNEIRAARRRRDAARR